MAAEGTPSIVPLDIQSAYRKWVQDRCQYMDIDRLREKSDVIQVKLPEIFVPLYANDPQKKSDEKPDALERLQADRSAAIDIEDLAVDAGDLVIEGLPGPARPP